jgi:hypothetical protein
MGPKPDQLMLAGPHSAIVGILAQILRPKYLIDPVNDPAGNFGKQIQETRPFQKLREHGIDPRILHNLCVAFRLLKRVKKQEAQLRQARKELVRGRKHIRAAAQGNSRTAKRQCSAALHRCLQALTNAREGNPRRFHSEFCALAELVFERTIDLESYMRIVRYVYRYLCANPPTVNLG